MVKQDWDNLHHPSHFLCLCFTQQLHCCTHDESLFFSGVNNYFRYSVRNTQKHKKRGGDLLLLIPKSKVMLSLDKVTSGFSWTKAHTTVLQGANLRGLKSHLFL